MKWLSGEDKRLLIMRTLDKDFQYIIEKIPNINTINEIKNLYFKFIGSEPINDIEYGSALFPEERIPMKILNELSKEVYRQSPFGEIAREMQKKDVITVVMDQRPSELDPDVIGMVWTNFVFTLTDTEDIKSLLLCFSCPELFRNIILNLASREVLIYGEAVRFPVVLKVKDYNIVENFFNDLIKKINEEILRRREGIEREFL
ncbi:MAG: hypothetical protein QXP60_06580 [Nitrososphaerota archaeon]